MTTANGDDVLQLRLCADGYLDADVEATPRWVRRLRLADDCHSANVQLQAEAAGRSSPPTRCRVRAVRPLSRGQSVQLWFADDLLPCLRLPFLAPHNIQGEKRYVCHHCGRSFEFPNPLKLHLALDCGREDVSALWRRLQRLGAHPGHQGHQASYHQHASDMETLVSNLGRSKQGHLCIYCGKVYSRKYGLKIHIRTHTGFKPLKCKYCLRPFGDPSNLNKHVRLHAEGDTPYKCDLCGKVLVRRRDLERHVKSRHQDGVEGDGEGLGDWDNDMDTDNDNEHDDDDVEVDVDVGDEEDQLHCNGNSMRKEQRQQRVGVERDIPIPTA
ncbi:PR domain zinc finger protein 13-like [Thrips palmi]|uniref:PR domain zinc finger protein 13-like n=1 Tax=Thrips palmi TaxID=161013 RepID=A0A6P8YLR3_THRPL|nr:PR domain zinc finger protein 13-like [Thrips palmi]